jgi:hypothetical protein
MHFVTPANGRCTYVRARDPPTSFPAVRRDARIRTKLVQREILGGFVDLDFMDPGRDSAVIA